MNKAIEKKLLVVINLERTINQLNHEKDKMLNDIQELSNTFKGIEQKISMYQESLNKEYMGLKEEMIKETK